MTTFPGVVTYSEVGATRTDDLPPGYHHARRHVEIGRGRAAFAAVAESLATFGPQRGAGLRVRTDAARVAVGVRLAVGLGVGPLRIWAPCEVVWVAATDDTYGWGYGTLPGHPERGEEAWSVSIDAEERVWCDIRAFSRPARWYMRLGGPVAGRVQRYVTDRYVRAMAAAVNS